MTDKVEYDTDPDFDVEKVSTLLEILDLSRDEPNLRPIFSEAYRALTAIGAEMLEKQRQEKEEEAA